MSTFFQRGDALDRVYCNARDGIEEHHVRGRQTIEGIWSTCSVFVDSDAPDKAMRDLLPVFWELHLANILLKAGKRLQPRKDLEYQDNMGPDLFAVDTPGVWIEAIAVKSGSGPDGIPIYNPEEVNSYNPDGVVLRLRQAISVKSEKMRRYLEHGIIKPGQATIIAISGVALPFRSSGRYPPEIVRAVYPVDNPVLVINSRTGEVMDRCVEYRDHVKKAGGANVATNVFLTSEHSHISAVLFDDSDWVHYPDPPGANTKLVHNAEADVHLPDGWFPVGDEYWWRDDAIVRR